MTLKMLIEKLKGKPNQNAEVQFLVFEKQGGAMVCCDLEGPSTIDIMNAIAKRKGGHAVHDSTDLGAADQRAHAEWEDGEGAQVLTSTGIWHAAIAYERKRVAALQK
jgi:hypothetical protein